MSRGRGRTDALRGISAEPDPMQEDYYNPEFNSYPCGPGADAQWAPSADGKMKKILSVLFVRGFSSSINERGIRNIFSSYGEIQSIFMGPKGTIPPEWCKIYYSSHSEAQAAIDNLHQRPPHFLTVSYARERKTEEKSEVVPEVVKPPIQTKTKIQRSGAGRGKLLPLNGLPPSMITPVDCEKPEDFYDENDTYGYDGGKFNLNDPSRETELSNAVFGKRAVVKTSPHANVLGRTIRMFQSRFGENPWYCELPKTKEARALLEEKIRQEVLYPKKDEIQVYAPPDRAVRSICSLKDCGRESVSLCSVCKAWYCSYDCLKLDWPEHKKLCKPRDVTIDSEGNMVVKDPESKPVVDSGLDQVNGAKPLETETLPVKSPSQRSYRKEPPLTGYSKPKPRNPMAEISIKSELVENENHVLNLFDESTPAKVEVNKVMSEDCFTGTLVLGKKSGKTHINPDKLLSLLADRSKMIQLPKVGDYVMAYLKGNWFRGYVMKMIDGEPSVALIDYGRVAVSSSCAPLLEEDKAWADAAVRVILKNPVSGSLVDHVGAKLELKDVKKEKGKLTCTVESYGEVEIVPWIPQVEEAGLPAISLEKGSTVMISAYESPSCVYLRSLNQKDDDDLNAYLQDLAFYAHTVGGLLRRPYCGEVILVMTQGDYMRAKVVKKHGQTYEVVYVDYGNSEKVSTLRMKPLKTELKKVPCFAVKVGLKGVSGPAFNLEAMKYLNNLALISVPLILMYDKELKAVTLTTKEGTDINQKLVELMKPSWETRTHREVLTEMYKLSDMTYEPWAEGAEIHAEFVDVPSYNKILVVDRASTIFLHISTVLTNSITDYCEKQCQDESYNPRDNEMVLAKYSEDGKWYRAVCLRQGCPASFVLFVDFGNNGLVEHAYLRRMIPEFMEIPAALKSAKHYGLPPASDLSEETQKSLMDFFNELRNSMCIVIADLNNELSLWIADFVIYAANLGIIIDRPSHI